MIVYQANGWRRSRPCPPRFEGDVSEADRGSFCFKISKLPQSNCLKSAICQLPHNEGAEALRALCY